MIRLREAVCDFTIDLASLMRCLINELVQFADGVGRRFLRGVINARIQKDVHRGAESFFFPFQSHQRLAFGRRERRDSRSARPAQGIEMGAYRSDIKLG